MNNTNIFSTHIGPDVFQIHLNETIEVQKQECNRMLNARQIFDTDGCTHTDKFSKKHPVYDVPYYRKNGAADYFDCAVCASTIETIITKTTKSNPANVYHCIVCDAFICSECKSRPPYVVEAGKRRRKIKKKW